MAVKDKELIINGKAIRSPEQQVFKNMEDIAELQEVIKPEYKCTTELSTSATSVAKSYTNADESVKSGWLLDPVGKKFKITGGDEDNLLIVFYTSYQGPQGPSGVSAIDDSTTSNTKVWSSNKTNSEVVNAKEMQGVYWTTETPTYDSDNDSYIFTKSNIEPGVYTGATGKTLYQIVDSKVKYIYTIVSFNNTNINAVLVGEVGGGKQLYQHNINISDSGKDINIILISDSNTQFDKSTFRTYVANNLSGSIQASGYFKVSASAMGIISGLIFSGATTVYVRMCYIDNGAVSVQSTYAITSAWTSMTLTDTIISL